MKPYQVHELVRLALYLKFSQVAHVGLRSGTTMEDVRQAGLEAGLTRQGVLAAMKRAGFKVRKTKEKTLTAPTAPTGSAAE